MHQSYDPDIGYLSDQIEALSRQVLALQNQVHTLTVQNDHLKRHLEERQAVNEQSLGTQFLLSDFSEIGQFWRHTDSRLGDALKLYLTINTIAVSGGAILVSQTRNIQIVLVLLSGISFLLYWAGVFLSIRIVGVWVGKRQYNLALNKIRAYFAEGSPQITAYLTLPIVNVNEDVVKAIESLKKYRNPLVIFIRIWSSLLISFCITSLMFIAFPRLPSPALLVLALLVFSLSLLILRYWEINSIGASMDSFESLRA